MWEANVQRVINGKRGQKLLREFIDALMEIPNRRLIANAICRNGEVCAVGAMAKKRGVLDTSRDWEGDQHETVELGQSMGLGFMLSWEIGSKNDIEFGGDDEREVVRHYYSGHYGDRRDLVREPSRLIDAGDGRLGYIDRKSFVIELWTGLSNRTGRPDRFAAYDPVGEFVISDRRFTPEDRWQALHKWASAQLKWNLPVPVQ